MKILAALFLLCTLCLANPAAAQEQARTDTPPAPDRPCPPPGPSPEGKAPPPRDGDKPPPPPPRDGKAPPPCPPPKDKRPPPKRSDPDSEGKTGAAK